MQYKFFLSLTLLYIANSFGAAGSKESLKALEGKVFAICNSADLGFKHVPNGIWDDERTLWWRFTYQEGHGNTINMIQLKKNTLIIKGVDYLGRSMSQVAEGNAASYIVLNDFKFEGDGFEEPDTDPLVFERRTKQVLPTEMQKLPTLAAVVAVYAASKAPTLIIDINAALNHLNSDQVANVGEANDDAQQAEIPVAERSWFWWVRR